MLPNCHLPLATRRLRKSRSCPLFGWGKEIWFDILLSYTFSFLIWVFLHIRLFLAHKNTSLCIFLSVFVSPRMYFPCRYNIHTSYMMFFCVLSNFCFLCFPSIFLILVFHRSLIFHWMVIRKLLCFGFWIVKAISRWQSWCIELISSVRSFR